MKNSLRGYYPDFAQILAVGVAMAALSLLSPFLILMLFDHVIPSASWSGLWYVAGALIVAAISSFILSIAQTISIARVAQHVTHRAQSALLERLLSMGPQFFRRFSSSDLAYRALSIDAAREVLNDATISSILVGVFSLVYWAALFVVDPAMALVVSLMLLIQLAILVVFYRIHLRALNTENHAVGQGSAWLYDVLSGISKIRVAHAEGRVFDRWLDSLREQLQAGVKVGKIATLMTTFNAAYQVLIFAVMVFVVAQTPPHYLTLGRFLAFGALLLALSASISKLSEWVSIALQVVPNFHAIKPILTATPEVTERKADVGMLLGDIEVRNANFQYEGTTRQILFDVNLRVSPGQFVAIVGSSGSGKSTLLRLLLGFEDPSSGAVFYDGQNLSTINIAQVRKQLGVVLQNGKLFPGSILDNIVGASMLTLDDAMHAAQMCGLDEDIHAMPMGLQTLVNVSGGISGGQRQRILIARALVRKPKILFFDEATSALDNQTQQIVTDSIAKLQVARVVIAHRLSTIRHADQIHVLEHGRMVEAGNFDQLMAQGGVFAKLAKRQMV